MHLEIEKIERENLERYGLPVLMLALEQLVYRIQSLLMDCQKKIYC